MTKKFNQLLSEDLGLDESTQSIILEEWENRLSEARKEISADLREEFAQKFSHDKARIVEAMDKFLGENLQKEIEELAEDKKNLHSERVKYNANLKEHAALLNSFVTKQLKAEILEHRQDRQKQKKSMKVLEGFVMKQLAEEIKEFNTDKQALREERVKLVTEGKKQIQEAKVKFIQRAAKVLDASVNAKLNEEISQLKEDISQARENEFGRTMFEAFKVEFMNSHLNESKEIGELKQVNQKKDSLLESQSRTISKLKREVNAAKDRLKREQVMESLLSPLSNEKKKIMQSLLETTNTSELKAQFNKYLPAVLNQTGNRLRRNGPAVITESVGNKKTKNYTNQSERNTDDEISQMIELAGIKEIK